MFRALIYKALRRTPLLNTFFRRCEGVRGVAGGEGSKKGRGSPGPWVRITPRLWCRLSLPTHRHSVPLEIEQWLLYILAMPTLKRFPALKIEMRYRDHLPPHVHVLSRERREALIEIETLAVVGNIPLRELGEALAWVADNRAELLETWRRYHP